MMCVTKIRELRITDIIVNKKSIFSLDGGWRCDSVDASLPDVTVLNQKKHPKRIQDFFMKRR